MILVGAVVIVPIMRMWTVQRIRIKEEKWIGNVPQKASEQSFNVFPHWFPHVSQDGLLVLASIRFWVISKEGESYAAQEENKNVLAKTNDSEKETCATWKGKRRLYRTSSAWMWTYFSWRVMCKFSKNVRNSMKYFQFCGAIYSTCTFFKNAIFRKEVYKST